MHKRLLDLDAERGRAVDEARVLHSLQRAWAGIAITRNPREVVVHFLNATRMALGFSRGFFVGTEVSEHDKALGFDEGDDLVTVVDDPYVCTTLNSIRNGQGQITGTAQDLCAPLVDTRDWYVVEIMEGKECRFGTVYLDGYSGISSRAWVCDLVHSLANLATASLDNAVLYERANRLATRDPLTGLYNRRALSQRVLETASAFRTGDRGFTYVLVDVDDFKKTNDVFGHAFGDALLQRVAASLSRTSRVEDVVSRFAGDEFVVLLRDVDAGTGRALVERISADLQSTGLRCSIGAAHFPDSGDDTHGLFAAADRALYAAKGAGKNGFVFSASPPAPTS